MFHTVENATITNIILKDNAVSGSVTRSIFANTLSNSTVENMHVLDSRLNTSHNTGTGPIAGNLVASELNNISVTNTQIDGSRFLGGLFGLYNGKSTLTNAYVNAHLINNETYMAGIATLGYAGSHLDIKDVIVNVEMVTAPTSLNTKGGLFGQNASATLDGVLVIMETNAREMNKILGTQISNGSVNTTGRGVYTIENFDGVSSTIDGIKEI